MQHVIRDPSTDDLPVRQAIPAPARQRAVAVGLTMIPEESWASSASSHVQRCLGIPGVGPITGLAMVATCQRAQLLNDDVFVAIIGLDIRFRESGQYRGPHKLTGKGEPELQ